MMSPLQEFLWNRKTDLLEKEKRATGQTQTAITMQLQVIDSMFRFLATQQTEEDMEKLKLTLEKQATPVDDIRPRQDNHELTESLIELADKLKEDWAEEVRRAKRENRAPKDLKFHLNNLPDSMKPKSISTKIYALRGQSKLPANVLPAIRTVKEKTLVDGKEVTTLREELYMKWVSNPPKVEAGAGE